MTEIERKKTATSDNQDRNREKVNSNTLNIVEEENRRNNKPWFTISHCKQFCYCQLMSIPLYVK
jgi:hypothetical protein